MKRLNLKKLIIPFLVLGIGIASIPSIINYIYEKQALKDIHNYETTVNNMNEETILKEKESVKLYNRSLLAGQDEYVPPSECLPYNELLDIGHMMGYLECPTINIKLPIYHGTSDEVLVRGVGHTEGSSLPMGGKSTHVILSAHRGILNATLFSNLDDMQIDDLFYITVLDEILTYKVYDIEVVEPEQVDSLSIVEGKDLVTLVTCTPYGVNSHRLLVHGQRFEDAKNSIVSEARHWPVRKYLSLMILAFAILVVIIFVHVVTKNKVKRVPSEEGLRYKNSHYKGLHYKDKHYKGSHCK